MPYIPHSAKEISEMLERVGAASIEELLAMLPADVRIKKGFKALEDGISEHELSNALKDLAQRNRPAGDVSCFLGAGAYNHYIPAVVDALISRSEFYTAYTPYQPEISQGTLQAIFEYQTLVCQLTAMDVSNASLYDGASAVAEAVLMARRLTGRDKVYLSSALHPEYRETVRTYLKGAGDHVFDVMFCADRGTTLVEAVEKAVGDDPACLVIQHPNFFGSLEDLEALGAVIHARKGLLISVTNEGVSLGILKPPGDCSVDIAVGDLQSFGNTLSFGGPYLGFMSTRTESIRQMPGRIIGQTVDKNGNRAFCLTFATREQHIRRERATSNICTNHGLCALAASMYLTGLGASGLRELALQNVSKADYLKERLLAIPGVKQGFSSPVFNEFTLKLEKDVDSVLKALLKKRIAGGVGLGRFYSQLKNYLLVTATEMNSKEDMDRFAAEFSRIMSGRELESKK